MLETHMRGTSLALTIDAGIQVMERMHMSGDIAVEGGEKFHSEQEDVCEHRIGDDLRQCLYRLCSRVKFRKLSHQQRQQDQE